VNFWKIGCTVRVKANNLQWRGTECPGNFPQQRTDEEVAIVEIFNMTNTVAPPVFGGIALSEFRRGESPLSSRGLWLTCEHVPVPTGHALGYQGADKRALTITVDVPTMRSVSSGWRT